MLELTNERIDKILHEETMKTEDLKTILRSIYTRYLRLYEKYFADIDALNDDMIAELRAYHEETVSLVKYYYMDIPYDICNEIEEFDEKYTDILLGAEWHETLFENFEEFRDEEWKEGKSGEYYKAMFAKGALENFYYAIGLALRKGFATESKTVENTFKSIKDFFFGNKEEDKEKE